MWRKVSDWPLKAPLLEASTVSTLWQSHIEEALPASREMMQRLRSCSR
jgi:hypothetical protein